MYCINESYQEAFYQSNIFRNYFEDLNFGVIDIETTGLNPDRSHFILGGLVIPEHQGKRAIQMLSETVEEESALLRSYLQELKKLDVLISYNGDHFDLPFLNKRIRNNRIPREEVPVFQSFDLYRILDKHSTFRKLLPNLKQKTVETFLGLWSDRADEISGAESVQLYQKFLRTGDAVTRDTILLHNKDDILQLSRLIKVFEKLNLHKVMFHTGFAVAFHNKKAFVQRIQLGKDSLSISGAHKNISMDYRCYQSSHESIFRSKPCSFTVKLPFKSSKGFDYIDLEEFVFDCSPLEKYAGYQSGYLLLKKQEEIQYAEVNHLIRLILKEILKEI